MKFTDYLSEYVSNEMVSFHMPGHKGRGIFDVHGFGAAIDSLVEGDITEIPGSDNLAQPQGIIRSVMDRYKALYGSEESFISVGGSTLGIMASILAAVEWVSMGRQASQTVQSGEVRNAAEGQSRGDRNKALRSKIAIARNSHKSVFNGVRLAGAQPIYIYPELPTSGIAGGIKPEAVEDAFVRASHEEGKIVAVVVPNPNYYGICSDIESIAEIAHKHGAVLIVDQAHGAHLRFLEPRLSADVSTSKSALNGIESPMNARVCNAADIVIESTHKTLASFTQTAIVNVYNKALIDVVEEKIKMLQTTSPSYMLMKSLDMNAKLIEENGDALFESWRMNLDNTYAALDKMGIEYFMDNMLDRSKILIDMSKYGLDGIDLSKELFERGIVNELDSGPYSMCMSGIGNSKVDYECLIKALKDIKTACEGKPSLVVEGGGGSLFALMNKRREMREIPTDWEWKPANEAAGCILAENIIPYPPGIPLIAAGEVADEESLAWAAALSESGGNVLGMNEDGAVKVAKNL